MDIKDTGLKKTKGRTEIIKILQKEETPVDVLHINSHLQKQNVSINQATIYRILDMFLKRGVVNRIQFQEGKFRYELSSRKDHHHFLCENCGRIEDISDCSVEDLEKEITKKKELLIKRHSLEFFGICHACIVLGR